MVVLPHVDDPFERVVRFRFLGFASPAGFASDASSAAGLVAAAWMSFEAAGLISGHLAGSLLNVAVSLGGKTLRHLMP